VVYGISTSQKQEIEIRDDDMHDMTIRLHLPALIKATLGHRR
jgi:hypothetical protein